GGGGDGDGDGGGDGNGDSDGGDGDGESCFIVPGMAVSRSSSTSWSVSSRYERKAAVRADTSTSLTVTPKTFLMYLTSSKLTGFDHVTAHAGVWCSVHDRHDTHDT